MKLNRRGPAIFSNEKDLRPRHEGGQVLAPRRAVPNQYFRLFLDGNRHYHFLLDAKSAPSQISSPSRQRAPMRSAEAASSRTPARRPLQCGIESWFSPISATVSWRFAWLCPVRRTDSLIGGAASRRGCRHRPFGQCPWRTAKQRNAGPSKGTVTAIRSSG